MSTSVSNNVITAVEDQILGVMRRYALPSFLVQEDEGTLRQLIKERIAHYLSTASTEDRTAAAILVLVGGICERLQVTLLPRGSGALRTQLEALLGR